MTFKELIHSKKFWTLVTSIVAALAAYFAVSCSAARTVTQRATSYSGNDSVVMEIIYDDRGNIKKR